MDNNFYPAHVLKFCPRCGSKKFKSTSNKSFLCGDCRFTFFTNAAAAVAGIIENGNGEILLTVRGREPEKGTLDLPGGFVDPNETGEEALIREVKEELNIDIAIKNYYSSFWNEYFYNEIIYYTLDLIFICNANDFSSLKADEDVSDFLFMKKEDIKIEDIGLISIKKVMKNYLESVHQVNN